VPLFRVTKEENQELIDRRVAAEGYPASEALWVSVVEYVKFLEGQCGLGPCVNQGGYGPCKNCDCGS